METKSVISDKSRAAVTILAFFLGVLGIHRMYVGKVGTGLVMLLLTLTGICVWISGIWALLDFIMAVIGQFKDNKGVLVSKW